MAIVDVSAWEPNKDPMPGPYRAWANKQDVPVHTGLYCRDVRAVETDTWDLTGERGALINLYGTEGVDDLHVHELTPGGETSFQKHLYEEIVYVMAGNGSTVIGEDEIVFEWEENALFFIPHNTPYKHINTSGDESARLVAQTSLPQYLNMIEDEEFIFDNKHTADLSEDFFSAESSVRTIFEDKYDDQGAAVWDANYIPDINTFDKLQGWSRLGNASVVFMPFPGSSARAHLAEMGPAGYKTAHRHQPGSHVFVVQGEGYSLTWPTGSDEKYRLDWTPGAVYPPPAYWYHTHFVLGDEPMRSLAMHPHRVGTLHVHGVFDAHDDINFIPYAEEDEEIRELYEEELAKEGRENKMPDECYEDPDYKFF